MTTLIVAATGLLSTGLMLCLLGLLLMLHYGVSPEEPLVIHVHSGRSRTAVESPRHRNTMWARAGLVIAALGMVFSVVSILILG